MGSLSFVAILVLCPSEAPLAGAWLLDGVKWTNAPRDIDPQLQSGGAGVLYFRKDHSFAFHLLRGVAASHSQAHGVW
jgi:hypothetical protein